MKRNVVVLWIIPVMLWASFGSAKEILYDLYDDTGYCRIYEDGSRTDLFSLSSPTIGVEVRKPYPGLCMWIEDVTPESPAVPSGEEPICAKIHVCDETGKDKVVVPVRTADWRKYYNQAGFIGPNYVYLSCWTRFYGVEEELYVNLITKETVLFSYDVCFDRMDEESPGGRESWTTAPSPDNLKLAHVVNDQFDKRSDVYINFKKVLPSEGGDEIEAALSSMLGESTPVKGSPNSSGPRRRWNLGEVCRKSWSPDSRYLALWNRGDAPAMAEGTISAAMGTQPNLVIVDTEKIGDGSDWKEYTLVVPFDIEEKDIEFRRAVFQYAGTAIWDATTNSVGVGFGFGEEVEPLNTIPFEEILAKTRKK